MSATPSKSAAARLSPTDARPRCRSRMSTNPAHLWHPLSRAAGSILLLAAASCAPPPTTASVAIPPIPPQQGRVWFYREVDTADQNTTTPYVRLNGAIAGVPEQGGAFYRDVSPGRYQITVDSEGRAPAPPATLLSSPGSRFTPGSGSAGVGTARDSP